MKHKQWLWLAAMSLLAGCSSGENTPPEPDPNVCSPRCGWDSQCVNGECIEKTKICNPACTDGFVCLNNTCVDPNVVCIEPCAKETTCVAGQCIPDVRVCSVKKCDENGENCTDEKIACKEDELCIDNACLKESEHCEPGCDPVTQKCFDKQCVFIDPYCDPQAKDLCNGDLTKACSKDTTPAQWVECLPHQSCQAGKCVLKSDLECDPTLCSDNRTMCYQGKRVACNATYEVCQDNECVIRPDAKCTPEKCINNAPQFICNDKAKPEKCPEGQRCQDGACFTDVEASAVDIWTICEDDSECATGRCVKKVTVGLNDNGTDKEVYFYDLDRRIEQGKGICSEDCSQDAAVCDNLAHDGETGWTCQIIQEGKSPYGTKDVDEETLAAGTPFAAVCRPPQNTEAGWSKDFCGYCDETTPCADGYRCVNNACMEPCVSDSNCPIFFKCQESKEAKTKVCMPLVNVCGQCDDKDGDGSGIGHCEKKGVDCDENDPTIFYSPEKPAICEKIDRNCNGIMDHEELLNSNEHMLCM